MRDTVLSFAVFFIIYGLAGLIFQIQKIPDKYRGKSWVSRYARIKGLAWLILGVLWLVLFTLTIDRNLDTFTFVLLLIACAVPSAIIYLRSEKKFSALLESEDREKN